MVVYRGDSAVAQLDVYAAEDMEKTAVGGLAAEGSYYRGADCSFSRGAVYSPKDMAP